jgi:hypothetical protein
MSFWRMIPKGANVSDRIMRPNKYMERNRDSI